VLAAIARKLPVLAICRGMQVLNVALGGDLVQHLPDQVGSDEHCPVPGEHGRHPIRVAGDSVLATVWPDGAQVATYHHQAVQRLGEQLNPTAWAADGTVEAVECAGAGWLIGVQWHPEVLDGAALFQAFVRAATAYRDGAPR
jgi:gamma-glutamyl-gamma-aminobutyrate hydrolase PuuD